MSRHLSMFPDADRADGNPSGVITDAAAVFPAVPDELKPSAWHHVAQYRRGHYELGLDAAPWTAVAAAFSELTD